MQLVSEERAQDDILPCGFIILALPFYLICKIRVGHNPSISLS